MRKGEKDSRPILKAGQEVREGEEGGCRPVEGNGPDESNLCYILH